MFVSVPSVIRLMDGGGGAIRGADQLGWGQGPTTKQNIFFVEQMFLRTTKPDVGLGVGL